MVQHVEHPAQRGTAEVLGNFLREQYDVHKNKDRLARPLLVGLQGPQGSGKSFACNMVVGQLAASTPALRVVILSLDDLYLPYDEITKIATANPNNALLQGRGQPLTHDLALGTDILHKLRHINDAPHATVTLPQYDKSARDGRGDRNPESRVIYGPVDIIIFEGWCLGFRPQNMASIEARRYDISQDSGATLGRHRLEDIEMISKRLGEWEKQWYCCLDAFVQLSPITCDMASHWSLVYPWRLEAERNRKARNGGRGMTDAEVWTFVQRFLPTYEAFDVDVRTQTRWPNRTLWIGIGPDRSVEKVAHV
ncbi:glycerate 3-kinase [Malassezia sp. CBS 17886]|nr:glycerate 3-kinase [Malassezia sp. CBS 17886]